MPRESKKIKNLRRLSAVVQESIDAHTPAPLTFDDLTVIQECLQRATPLLVYQTTPDKEWRFCPNCQIIFEHEYVYYCQECGQRLLWRNTAKMEIVESPESATPIGNSFHSLSGRYWYAH